MALLRQSLQKPRECLAEREARAPLSGDVQFHRLDPDGATAPCAAKGDARGVGATGNYGGESMAGKLEVLRFGSLGTSQDPDALDAPENDRMHLTDTGGRLVARQRVIEEERKGYEKAGSDIRG